MITFYDIPSKLAKKAWSPNTLRTRICLNYKGIPYKTEWIEYPDIESTVRRHGGKPTGKRKNGDDFYTLPAIYDSTTGKTITDSKGIAEYLDETYPGTPSLFPPGTRAAVSMLQSVLRDTFLPIVPITIPATNDILNSRSAEYFRRTREQLYGKKLEEFSPSGPVCDAIWKEAKDCWEKVARFYDENGPPQENPFFFGNTFSFADAIVIAYFIYFRTVLGAESDEWRDMLGWGKGRWAMLLDRTEKWQAVNGL